MNPPTVMKTTTPKVETFQHAFPVISIFSQAPGRGAGLAEASRLWGPFDIERWVLRFISQVQFNLDLSEKEREDRSKVILPFEHQGLPSWTLVKMQRGVATACALNQRGLHCWWFMSNLRAWSVIPTLKICTWIWHSWNLSGDGREAHIYDGRPDPVDSQFRKLGLSRNPSKDNDSQNLGSSQGVVGEIHYLRDSDDERPDSDEDPDDDLDI